MVVYQIIDLINKEEFFVNNKTKFCEEKGLTVRLLGYTHPSNPEETLRLHHKGFKYVSRMVALKTNIGSFDEWGEYRLVKLWGTNELVCVYKSDTVSMDLYKDCHVELRTKSEIIVDDTKEIETNDKTFLTFDPSILTRKKTVMGSIPDTLEDELVKANKKIQDLQDKLRISRKNNRFNFRKDNIQDHFQEEVIRLLKNKTQTLKKDKRVFNKNYTDTLMVQLSDLHFGKVVDLPNNKFNYKVAEERLLSYAGKVVDIIDKEGIGHVIVVFTGDIFNLDSHFDSLLTNEDNRASMFVRGLDMISEFLSILWTNVAELEVVGVLGNESRVRTTEYNSNVDTIANNNMDTLLFSILRRVLPSEIHFKNNCDTLQDVFDVGGFKVAICHGDKLKKHNDEEVNKFKLRMYETYGVMVDMVIFGHIHSTQITSNWCRSGSLAGTDHYYANGMNGVGGTPSQNIYYVTEEGITGREIKL